VIRLYDWGVAPEAAGAIRAGAVGVSDDQQRAQALMVQALHAVPAGVTARGWVTVMFYVPKQRGYQRHALAAWAERDASGTVTLLTGGCDG
jgi:hypothetical protein